MKGTLVWALVPALLASTAALADDATPHYGLSITGGVTAFNLPDGQNGVLSGGGAKVSGTTGQFVLGETLGISAAVDLGKMGDYDSFVGANLFGSYSNGGYSSTQTFSGMGFVAIPGLTTPANASISLTTSRSSGLASVGTTVQETDPQGNTYTADAGGTSTGVSGQSAWNVQSPTPTGPSFAMSGLNTDASIPSALAYAGIADTSGSIFLATGDLDGLSISTSTQNSIVYTGADITFGLGGNPDSQTSIQAYAGPSYRYIGQWNRTLTSLSVDIPAVSGSGTTHPLYILNREGEVSSSYLGAVVGGNISHQVTDAVSLSAGVEGSIYYAGAHLWGHESAETTGGVQGTNPVVNSQTVIVNEDPADVSQTALAYAVRGQTSATVALSPTLSLTGTVAADYLSAVARPFGGANIVSSGSGSDASWSSGSGGGNSLISFGSMIAYSGTVSLTGKF